VFFELGNIIIKRISDTEKILTIKTILFRGNCMPCVCVCVLCTYDPMVLETLSFLYIRREKPLNQVFCGFFLTYLSWLAAIKFATEFWVDYRVVKTTPDVKKEIRKIILKRIVALFFKGFAAVENIFRSLYTELQR